MGKPSIVETHPDVAAQLVGEDPSNYTYGSNKQLAWRCDLGHEFAQVVAKRTKRGQGCPVCAGKKVLPGFNDLLTTHPSVASRATFDPTTVSMGSRKVMWWACEKGHEYRSSVATQVRRPGCHFCSNKKVLVGFNDLLTTHPEVALQARFDPSSVTAGSDKVGQWICELGHVYDMAPYRRCYEGRSCSFCSSRKILVGFNDLATTRPDLAETANFDPTTVTKGSHSVVSWLCVEGGHTYETAVHRRASGRGCPKCSKTGFNDHQMVAKVYVLRDEVASTTKVGIAGSESDRVDVLASRGLRPVAVASIAGSFARSLERELLAVVRDIGLPMSKGEFEQHYGTYVAGWTEAVQDSDGAAMRAALEVIDRAKETPSLFAMT